MKETTTLLKMSLVGLFLTISTFLFAQVAPNPTTPITTPENLDVGTINDDQTAVLPVTTAVLFYNPAGTAITLTASETDVVTGLDYSSYVWHAINQDGTIAETLEEETGTLRVEGLQPGYYRYRVFGFIDDEGVICQSDEYQDMIFFVLRPLTPTANPGTGAITEFCLNEPPTDPLVLEADVVFDADVAYNANAFTNPAVGDFALTYRWYAVNSNDLGTQIPLTDPATTTNPGAINNIEIDYTDLTDFGSYTFFVEVQYANSIKDRGTRDHAIWTAQVMDGTEGFTIEVTQTPGRPTITIEAIED